MTEVDFTPLIEYIHGLALKGAALGVTLLIVYLIVREFRWRGRD